MSILMGLLPPVPAGPERIPVSEFASRGLEGWIEHSFQGHTRYRLVMIDDTRVLEAHSEASASALYRRIRVDLEQTPILRWRWRAGGTLGANDEQTRGGDDYAARIYLIKEGGLLPWRTMALNYVWSGNQPVGSSWNNAYSSRARMIALQSGSLDDPRWRSERRNVRDDFRRLFAEEVRYIDAVALMSDTDNSGATATAHYADIRFSAE
ncbi:MAG: DUF3047 domain-containing protein [Candidatus Sedimenticola endophacoides]